MDIIKKIKKLTNNSADVSIKKIRVLKDNIYLAFSNTVSDNEKITDSILNSINLTILKNKRISDIKEYLYNILPSGSIKIIKNDEIKNYIYNGYAIIVLNTKDSIAIETKEKLDRGINEVTDEPILRGSKDAFNENINKNIGLIRKRIKSTDLCLDEYKIGRYSKTKIEIMYINTICDKALIQEIVKKIKKIDVDGIIDSGYIRELVFDDKKNLFPTITSTTRPDKTSQALLEGKIVILVDNSPYVLILPTLFIDFFKVPEDYYVKNINTTFSRILRLICFLISILLPAFYIAFTTHNKESIPTTLLLNFVKAKEGVPFPTFLECLMIIILFEIIKESDMRLPNILGNSVSILGALVLGDAAISAGIISPIVVIIASLALVSSFVFNDVDFINAIRVYRIVFLIMSAIFGLYGIFITSIIFIIKLTSIKSLGKPYLYPFAPLDLVEIKDSFIRLNKNSLNKRNKILTKNIVRLKENN